MCVYGYTAFFYYARCSNSNKKLVPTSGITKSGKICKIFGLKSSLCVERIKCDLMWSDFQDKYKYVIINPWIPKE